MKKIFVIASIFLCYGRLLGQVLLTENFDYSTGTDLIVNGWQTTYNADLCGITVGEGLIFEGYSGSNIGGSAVIQCDNRNDQPHLEFNKQDSGDIYVAFLFQAAINYTSGYFFALRDDISSTTFNFCGRIFLNEDYQLGLTFADNGKKVFADKVLDPTITYLIVLRYQIADGANNDTVSLYCYDSLPQSAGMPVIAAQSDESKPDIAPAHIVLRGYDANGELLVDGIRVGKTWHEAVGVTPSDDGNNDGDGDGEGEGEGEGDGSGNGDGNGDGDGNEDGNGNSDEDESTTSLSNMTIKKNKNAKQILNGVLTITIDGTQYDSSGNTIR